MFFTGMNSKNFIIHSLNFFYQQNSNTTVSILTFLQTFLNAQETQVKNCRQKRAAHERNRPECEQKANGITV